MEKGQHCQQMALGKLGFYRQNSETKSLTFTPFPKSALNESRISLEDPKL